MNDSTIVPTDELLSSLTQQVLGIARQAGKAILEVYSSSEFEVDEKQDNTPITTADLLAHRMIVSDLKSIKPRIQILSEESTNVPFEERESWQSYWLIDPLDGTREFINRSGEFSVNIALVHNKKPILGVIYAPVMDVAYYAYEQGGAWKQSCSMQPRKITARKLPEKELTVARGRSNSPRLKQFLQNLGQHQEVSMGAAIKSCLVAEGVADIYPRLGPTSEWDTAAAQCIVQEAGGRITDTNMRTLEYNSKPSLLNPHFLVFGSDERDWSSYLDPAHP